MLNCYGRVCESTVANIFFIKNEMIYTPSLNEGCVAGIMRQFLLKTLPVKGFQIIEKEITIDELVDADEVFLTNSIQNIRWVKKISDKIFDSTVTRKIYSLVFSSTG